MPGNRNILFKKQPEGLQINVGPNGLKIQNK